MGDVGGYLSAEQVRSSPVPLPDPRYWGSQFWFTMHTIAYFYPDNPTPDEMRHAINFYRAIGALLPCPSCAAHFAQMLDDDPVERHVGGRMALVAWVSDLHNKVNARLGKPRVGLGTYLHSTAHLEASLPAPPLVLGLAAAFLAVGLARYYYYRGGGGAP